MKRRYTIGLDGSGIDELIDGVNAYKLWIERKTKELARRLADMGALYAQFNFEGTVYSGNTDYEITVEHKGENAYLVKANGQSVLFIEFGAGVTHGYGYPGDLHGMGPGTYPGKGHWDDPNGWWYPTNDNTVATKTNKNGQGWVHTYGNPPNAPMYNAVKELEQEIKTIVTEVFSDD